MKYKTKFYEIASSRLLSGLAMTLWVTLFAFPLMAISPIEEKALSRIPNQKIVIFNDGSLGWQDRESLIKQAGGEPLRHLGLINAIVGYFPKGVGKSLAQHRSVWKIVDDGYCHMTEFDLSGSLKLDQTFSGAGKLSRNQRFRIAPKPISAKEFQEDPPKQTIQWGVARVGAPQAWGKTRGEGVKVCVIDSGGDVDHPDLAANIKGGRNFAADKEDPTFIDDLLGHGSHVSGIIAAVDNSTGVVGVAPQAHLYEARVFGGSGSTSWSTIIAALDWCASNDMRVVNMSLGGPGNDAMKLAIEKAYEKGLALVAAAGNSYGGKVDFPGAYPQSIAVSASDSADKLAYFSSKGPEVDLIAPGAKILSTVNEGGYASYNGTSMATPHVVGVAALVLASEPHLTNAQVKELLESKAINLNLDPNEQGRGLASVLFLKEAPSSFSR